MVRYTILIAAILTFLGMYFLRTPQETMPEGDEPLAVISNEASDSVTPDSKTAWIDDERIKNADSEPGNWLASGRTYEFTEQKV